MIHARRDYDARIQDSAGLIPDDEPVLFIRGQDVAALPALDAWLEASMDNGVDKDVIDAMRRHRTRIEIWQQQVKVKAADCDKGLLR